jgi:hypothetical protein
MPSQPADDMRRLHSVLDVLAGRAAEDVDRVREFMTGSAGYKVGKGVHVEGAVEGQDFIGRRLEVGAQAVAEVVDVLPHGRWGRLFISEEGWRTCTLNRRAAALSRRELPSG